MATIGLGQHARQDAETADLDRDHLMTAIRLSMAKQPPVLGLEFLSDGGDGLATLDRPSNGRLLADIAQIPLREETTPLRAKSFRLEQRRRLGDHGIRGPRQDREMLLLQRDRDAALQIAAQIGVAHAERTEDPGKARHEYVLATGEPRNAARMQRSRAATRDQRKAFGIKALFDADVLDGVQHCL